MSKGKIFSKLNIFKKKKRLSRRAVRSNSTTESHHNTETLPGIVRGNTLPVTSRDTVESNLFMNKRKNLSISSVEDLDNKKKQPYLGPEQASSSNCYIPTPAPSATSSISHNIPTVSETDQKGKHRSSSSVSMSCDNKELEVIASTSSSLNHPKNDKMKDVAVESENEASVDDHVPKINITTNSNDEENPSASTSDNNKNKNKVFDTPPHTPTIFVTSKSTVSSIVDAYHSKSSNSNDEENGDTNMNEIKNQVDEFDMYVEDILNRINTEMDTEVNPVGYHTGATEPMVPGEALTTESLSPTHSNQNLINIANHPQLPSSLSVVQTNDITSPAVESNNAVNTLNTNAKKEVYANEIIKKANENKKDKVNFFFFLKKIRVFFFFCIFYHIIYI